MTIEENADEVSREDVAAFLGEDAAESVLNEYDPAEAAKTEEETDDAGKQADADDDSNGVADLDAEEAAADPEPLDDGEEEQQADISSKSGKYTIPFEKLTEARDGEAAAKAELEILKAQLDKLQAEQGAQVEADAEADDEEQAATDMDELAEEFPDAAKIIRDLQAQVDALSVDNKNNEVQQQQLAEDTHFDAIESAYEGSNEILTSQEFTEWVGDQPAIARDAYITVYNNGSTEKVIAMLDAFTADNPVVTPDADADTAPSAADVAAKKAEIEAKIKAVQDKASVPDSLSDVPGAADKGDPTERLLASNTPDADLDAMFAAAKTEEERNRLIDQLM